MCNYMCVQTQNYLEVKTPKAGKKEKKNKGGKITKRKNECMPYCVPLFFYYVMFHFLWVFTSTFTSASTKYTHTIKI